MPPRYIGCYTDDKKPGMRDLQFSSIDGRMTPVFCSDVCYRHNYTVFGVQYHNECYCSHSYGAYGVGNGCSYTCSGDSREICGGASMNSVYSVCDKGMHGLKCNLKCPCAPLCTCHRLNASII
ncbi:hypothetical protein HELRODRAFT_179286 [Helobdella robusta]|uniref:WSC domain-containing protein n=1 Tax=Helobdella robusta TaxID=6412 RepID=T1FEH4_HELRO|nr:hypothetical protein HELRODRAFT_179286 [Helobdella robusta]ESN95510.1 hypothetical protein HELRODRAFT_179286 [Helobdella robusta]